MEGNPAPYRCADAPSQALVLLNDVLHVLIMGPFLLGQGQRLILAQALRETELFTLVEATELDTETESIIELPKQSPRRH